MRTQKEERCCDMCSRRETQDKDHKPDFAGWFTIFYHRKNAIAGTYSYKCVDLCCRDCVYSWMDTHPQGEGEGEAE